jgi:glycosyltransferase involved in cell wall biosynthesis
MEVPELRKRLVEFPSASDWEIRNLYQHARVFVFPSLIEGFGIPPLEALWHGVPVVCSDIPVVREVCGAVVRYANPMDPADFARVILRTLREPQYTERRETGREWASRYACSESTRRYLALFRGCMDWMV